MRSWLGDGFFMRAGKASISGPPDDEDLKPFETLTELRCLSLDNTNITDEGIAHLKGSIHLQSLSLFTEHGTSKICGEGLYHVKNLPQLEELRLHNAPITDAGLAQLGELAQLKALHLSNWASEWPSDQPPRVTDAGLRHLGKLTKLESLNLTGTYMNGTLMTDMSLEHLKELTALRSLVLTWTDVTHAGLRHLTGLTELRELQLSGKHLIGPGLKHLKELKRLSILCLSEGIIGEGNFDATYDKYLVHLAGLTRIERLALSGYSVTDAAMKYVAVMPNLQDLSLNAAMGVTDGGLERLKKLNNLRSLDLSSCGGITDSGLENLKRFTHLESLNLSNTPRLTTAGVAKLQQALPNCKIYR